MRRALPGAAARSLALLLAIAAFAAFAALLASRPARADTLSIVAQQRIRAATFEVVQRKPEEGAVTYDRALPLELLPYQERIDKYRSVGTAFAIGSNRYVTAGHVFSLGMGSQFGPPALRDASGTVYDIDRVWKYSDNEDFVVFSLRTEPAGVQSLELGPPPAPNDAVYAVGNALGEGVVIRDGVYTSDTPEEQNGEWKWLRFSAAASPGNSGGPLIDQAGRVIGVVLRKSESENLNYALPIARVRDSKEGEGRLEGRIPIRLPIMDVSETLTVHERLALPAPIAQFYQSLQSIMVEQISSAQRALLAHNSGRVFPNSASSAQLLQSDFGGPFPRIISEGQDGQWTVLESQPQTAELDHNGFVETSQSLLRLRLPDDISLATLYGDSKLYMELLLKGYSVRRQVGRESVKVTSLGQAHWSSTYTDDFGRTWHLFAWAEPWDDTELVAMSLPTPEGYVSFVAPIVTGYRQLLIDTQMLMGDFVDVSLRGTLSQWQDYLQQKSVAPKALDAVKLAIDPARTVRYQSGRCELNVTPELLPLSKDAILWLYFSYLRDHEQVVWDVGGVALEESAQKNNQVAMWRYSRPGASLPQRFQAIWSELEGHQYPYNGIAYNDNGATRISAAAAPGAAAAGQPANILYVLTLLREGDQAPAVMKSKLELLRRSFKALE